MLKMEERKCVIELEMDRKCSMDQLVVDMVGTVIVLTLVYVLINVAEFVHVSLGGRTFRSVPYIYEMCR